MPTMKYNQNLKPQTSSIPSFFPCRIWRLHARERELSPSASDQLVQNKLLWPDPFIFKPRLFVGLLEICIRATVHVGGQRTTWESKYSSIHHRDLRDRTQLPQLWPQAPSPLSQLTSPWSVSLPMKCWLMVPNCVSVRDQQNNTKRIHPEVY